MITLYLISLITFFGTTFYLYKKSKENDNALEDEIFKNGVFVYILFLCSCALSIFGTLSLIIIFFP
jgi:hypothetical protein